MDREEYKKVSSAMLVQVNSHKITIEQLNEVQNQNEALKNELKLLKDCAGEYDAKFDMFEQVLVKVKNGLDKIRSCGGNFGDETAYLIAGELKSEIEKVLG